MAFRDSSAYSDAGQGTVAGLFSDYSKAEQAIADLKASGFSDSQIGLARTDESVEGTTTGTTSKNHGIWDKIKSAFGGHDREDESDYTYSDDFRGSLTSTGIPEDRARYFGSSIQSGGCLVTVNTSGGRASEAIAILERNGADIGSGAMKFGTRRDEAEPSLSEAVERRIQLLGEMLRVHKERVSRGEVRLRKDVITETKNIEVPVTREELVVERTSVSGDQPITGEIGSEKEIRVPLSEERVRVEKQSVVKGEVRVGKRQVQDTKTVSDEVRHEEIKVDKEGDVDLDDTKLKDKRDKAA